MFPTHVRAKANEQAIASHRTSLFRHPALDSELEACAFKSSLKNAIKPPQPCEANVSMMLRPLTSKPGP